MQWLDALAEPSAFRTLLSVLALGLLCVALHLVGRPLILRAVRLAIRRTRVKWGDALLESKVVHRLSLMIPLVALQIGIEWLPDLGVALRDLLGRLVTASMILVAALSFGAALNAAHALYLRLPASATRPIKSYVQLLTVVVYVVAGTFIVAQLADRSPWFFVSGLGAMMAIILLIFRDTILSLVASVQLTSNDLIRVGDWIEMPQFGADGDVVDIALNTVSVVNWDKTITVIPTHKFLEHSFKNWRNMYGVGRRIKRSININTSTIRFLTPEEIERLRRFALLEDYIAEKLSELEAFNARYAHDPDLIVNARRLTNIGTFRAYITAYLRNHPMIHQDLTFLVRQIEPTPEGLPLQIYVFTTDTRWAVYEGVQGDVFDHLLSIIPEFGLQVYQRPSGSDFAAAALDEGVPIGPEDRALASSGDRAEADGTAVRG